MFIRTASVGPWGTNCHVVAMGAGSECLVIDPGLGASQFVAAVTAEFRLKPVAVLATHGHVDHIWNLYPIATDLDIPAVIHRSDRMFLTDPGKAVSAEGAKVVASFTPNQPWLEPAALIEVSGVAELDFAGFKIKVFSTPGHTAGSVCFEFKDDSLFTGDLLFKNAIGRTDLFSGDEKQMQQSLAHVMNSYADDVLIYPGHGDDSTIGEERKNNPYLHNLKIM
jgi:glyoxylase-like metal-dependent hydrolase (beta-lactamase superfamily II)